ncbi:MAG TPA: hypothetical protein P5210_14125 [Draconibacterium sp.]|nr:hypothetical protein [Draconibacterium sp.]HRX12793.1 hypothetical protein [Draconibacterium sp.]
MEDSRIKLRTDVVRIAQMESDITNATFLINGRFRETLEAIGFNPSDELLRDCFFGNADMVTKEFHQNLHKELKGITMPVTRTMFENSAHDGLKDLNIVRAEIKGKYSHEVFKYISFEDGKAVFSDESKKQLFEDCSVYISSPEEIELYNEHLEACEALNKMFKGYRSQFWSQLFDFENGKFIPSPLVQYNVVLNNIKRNQ